MGTKRPVRTGEKDALGRQIAVSDQAAARNVTAPPPPDAGEVAGFDDRLAGEAASGVDHSADDAVWSWTNVAAELGEDQARDLYQHHNGHLGAALADFERQRWWQARNDQWAEAGITDRAEISRLEDRGVDPGQFTSDDYMVRQFACSMRGDLVFEGEMLSEAINLNRHIGHTRGQGRHVVLPAELRHGDLVDKASYIDGYASMTDAIANVQASHGGSWRIVALADRGWRFDGVDQPEQMSTHRMAGRRDAYTAAVFADDFAGGRIQPDSTVEVAEPLAGHQLVKIGSIESAPSAGEYIGVLAETTTRFNMDGETVPWTAGARIWFTRDGVKNYRNGDI